MSSAAFPPRYNREAPVPGLPADTASATNAAATVTYSAAGVGFAHALGGVAWSYSGTPTGGGLTIADGASTIFAVDVASAGPGFFPFRAPKTGSPNTALTVTLAAGGSGVAGKINVLEHFLIQGASVAFGVDFSTPDNSGLIPVVL